MEQQHSRMKNGREEMNNIFLFKQFEMICYLIEHSFYRNKIVKMGYLWHSHSRMQDSEQTKKNK